MSLGPRHRRSFAVLGEAVSALQEYEERYGGSFVSVDQSSWFHPRLEPADIEEGSWKNEAKAFSATSPPS